MALSIAFIVPAFNEEQNIEATVETILHAMGEQAVDYEIVLVNDGSSDRTGALIDRLAAANFRIHALHNSSNLNLGGAYKRGLSVASKEFVIMVPGDNGFGRESLSGILKNVGQADILIPYPTNLEARTPMRRLASSGFTALINCLFGFKIRYYNGPVVHRTALLRTITIDTNSFAYQAEALVKLLGREYSYVECPVETQAREGGRSSAMKLRNQITVFTTIVRLLLAVGPRCAFIRRQS